MSLRNPVSSGFYITGIDGLGPPKANVCMAQYSAGDGGKFSMARAEYRNITFQLGFMPFPTIEATRHRSYMMFPVKEPVYIKIETDERSVYTKGYVESNTPTIFSRNEGCSISVLCPDSYFRDVNSQETSLFAVAPTFTFPWSNTSGSSTLVMSSISNQTTVDIVYNGEAEAGVIVDIELAATVSTGKFVVYDYTQSKGVSIDVAKMTSIIGYAPTRGCRIVISTVMGEKEVYCKPLYSTENLNLLTAVTGDSDWFTLQKGINTFIVGCDVAYAAQYTFYNDVLYYGV